MPHRQPAAILILQDKPYPDRQQAMCQRYAEKHALRVVAICSQWPDCYVMVVNRHVKAVICAVHPGDLVVERIVAVGGEMRVVRRRLPQRRLRRDVAALAAKLRARGFDTREISEVLGVDSREIRRLRNGSGC